jgi:hypothetical protein
MFIVPFTPDEPSKVTQEAIWDEFSTNELKVTLAPCWGIIVTPGVDLEAPVKL